MIQLRQVGLDDKYTQATGRIFVTGIQALVRLPLMQRQRDLAAGLNTAGYITGDRGSPLGAYDADSDRFLVLDVASYKWPAVWVEATTLFTAMDTVDPDGGATRGFVVIGL